MTVSQIFVVFLAVTWVNSSVCDVTLWSGGGILYNSKMF